VQPSPRSLAKLAPVIDVKYEDLMRMCGYLQGSPSAPGEEGIEKDVKALLAEYLTALRDTPEWAWPTIVKATLGRAMGEVREWGQMIPSVPPEDRAPLTSADTGLHVSSIGSPTRRQRRMKPRYGPTLAHALG
jgi:hypothetical protein